MRVGQALSPMANDFTSGCVHVPSFLISVEKVVTSVLLAAASITTQATLADVSTVPILP